MSVRDATPGTDGTIRGMAPARALALAGGAVLSASYLEVLYGAVNVAGRDVGTAQFLAVVGGSVALAVVFSRTIAPREAVGVGAVLLAGGLVGYLLSVPLSTTDLLGLVSDTAALLTGLSILQVTRAEVWALGLAPAPVFLSGYFLLRRAYGPGVLAGGVALALVVLTGDAGTVQALVGVLGGTVALGFGDFDVRGGSPPLQNTLAVVLVAMLVVTTSVSIVPGGEARPLLAGGGGGTIEASLTESDARIGLAGSIRLSPTVRFTVTADRSEYWRVGAFDRYTGDTWIRTGRTVPYEGRLPEPTGRFTDLVRQTYTAESPVSTMPAAWKPVNVDAGEREVQVTDLGGVQPGGSFAAGDSYTVSSLVAEPSTARLQAAGEDYPAVVEDRYLQLPESTPARLGRFTTELTASASSPYEKAVVVERWLEESKVYSLDVERPEGDLASSFVFEMDRGYCTYYATAMVAMLRTQGIPARFVVGYTPGQQVAEERWVVRGLDSHAWVEVYFPGEGWVRFDPTPAAPRQATEVRRIERARENAEPNVDTAESLAVPITTTAPGNAANDTVFPEVQSPVAPATGEPNATAGTGAAAGSGGPFPGGLPPSPEALLYALVLLIGGVTAVVRLGYVEWLFRALWLRWLPPGGPRERVVAAASRAEYLLGRRYRTRKAGETRRAYLRAIADEDPSGGVDQHAAALFRLGELARHSGRVTESDAATADRLLGQLRRSSGRDA